MKPGITNFGYDRVAIKKVKGIKVGLVGTYVLADGLGVKDSMEKNIQDLRMRAHRLSLRVSLGRGKSRVSK